MEEKALYYQNAHLTEFTATVTGCQPQGENWGVVLDNTAFYPEGGGQGWDTGALDQAQVLAVREEGDRIVHTCDRPLPVGRQVRGRIDWPRRFDFMQQHTGEHILSGLVHRRYGFHNVGFHLGAETVTIDFDGIIPQGDLPALEEQVNQAIWQDVPVRAWFASPQELASLPYRSKRPLSGLVRLVEVPGYDLCACCGTHVARTGEIGLVKIFSWCKFHQGVRLEVAWGGRAFRYLAAVWGQNRQVSQLFSAKPLETAEAARKVQQELEAQRYRAAGLETRMFAATAAALAGKGDQVLFEDGLTPETLRRLADAVAETCGGRCCGFSGDGDRYRYALCSRREDLRPLAKAMNQALRGRGGGQPGLVQGSVQATREEILAFFEKENE